MGSLSIFLDIPRPTELDETYQEIGNRRVLKSRHRACWQCQLSRNGRLRATVNEPRWHLLRGGPGLLTSQIRDLCDWGDCVAEKEVNGMVNCEIRFTAAYWKQIHTGTVTQ
jgi:hypothetical protein